jgi:hypothetical protein
MTATLKPLSEEWKNIILNEQPGGLWIVLAEEFPQGLPVPADLVGGHPTFNSDESPEDHAAGAESFPR